MNAKATTAAIAPTIGTPYEGGFYSGKVRTGEGLFAVVVAPKAQGDIEGAWLATYTSVPGACSYFDSMANTKAMADAGSELAKTVLALEINGFTDWCIPARDVLELAYRNLKPTTEENYVYRAGDNPSSVPAGYPYTEQSPAQTTVEAFQDEGAEAFEEGYYWSSTQYSDDDAWDQDFNDGYQLNDLKSYEARCRAVRLIQLST
ncbi:MAG TPA: hypothetical protein VE934_12175 [Polaromonas sp.]|uniref:hypothetical protein n=1 Tax=Polaromonas sp. TaxID=1869339 RepID=UPI002D2D7493|nr:hypothetical protein [Polaromonas sp.]HYW57713.1 hypothetical protein [Polaromonas sp.]